MGMSTSDYSLVKEVARRHGASRVRLFGSRAKGVATPDSDLDLLVDLAPGRDLFDLIEMKQELEATTGLRVDLVTEKSLSTYLRARIIEEARPI